MQLTESRAERIPPGAENRLKIQYLFKIQYLSERFELMGYFSDFKPRGGNFKSSKKILLERGHLTSKNTLEIV